MTTKIPGTNVPAVEFSTAGFVAPSGPAILAGIQADINAAFGANLSYTLTTPQGQLAASEAALIVNFNSLFVYYTNQVNPAFASGRMQDAIGNIYFLERLPSIPTVLQVACGGLAGVAIPTGATIQDTAGNTYGCTAGDTIPVAGTITLPFDNLLPGPTAVPAADQISIYQAIPGWDSVAVVSGVVGINVETRTAFEQRRRDAVAGNSFGAIGSIIGAVARVDGVVDYFGYDNASSSPAVVAGVTVAPNTIYISVAGGTEADVAQAILSKKGPGCGYTGNTTVTAYDSNPLYSSPVPYEVTFDVPDALPILFKVNIVNGPNVPADATTLIQNAIISAFGGGDGGPKARIASTILATRYVAPVAALGAWALVSSLFVGSANTPGATFTGAISGTTLTVSGVTGTVAIGQTITDAAGLIAAGTKITAGAGSTWTVGISQTVPSRTMIGAVPTQTQVAVKGNQLPTIVAANILVALV